MTTDLVRTIFAYLMALVVFLTGGLFFYQAYLSFDTPVLAPEAQAFATALIGFMGMALQWVFGSATQAATARQQQSATDAGAAAGAMVPGTTTTVSEGPPMTVTTAPTPNGTVTEERDLP